VGDCPLPFLSSRFIGLSGTIPLPFLSKIGLMENRVLSAIRTRITPEGILVVNCAMNKASAGALIDRGRDRSLTVKMV
jgi:hypothetical protein